MFAMFTLYSTVKECLVATKVIRADLCAVLSRTVEYCSAPPCRLDSTHAQDADAGQSGPDIRGVQPEKGFNEITETLQNVTSLVHKVDTTRQDTGVQQLATEATIQDTGVPPVAIEATIQDTGLPQVAIESTMQDAGVPKVAVPDDFLQVVAEPLLDIEVSQAQPPPDAQINPNLCSAADSVTFDPSPWYDLGDSYYITADLLTPEQQAQTEPFEFSFGYAPCTWDGLNWFPAEYRVLVTPPWC